MVEAALFPRNLASNFYFFTFVLHYVGSGSESGSGTGMHYRPGSAKAKSCDSCGFGSGSGSTTPVIVLGGKMKKSQLKVSVNSKKNHTVRFLYGTTLSQ